MSAASSPFLPSLLFLLLLLLAAVPFAPASAQSPSLPRFAFCVLLTYQPSVANLYYTSQTFSGVFNSSAAVQTANGTSYTLNDVSGYYNASTLLRPSNVYGTGPLNNYIGFQSLGTLYVSSSGVGSLDAKGVFVDTNFDYFTLYATANGTVDQHYNEQGYLQFPGPAYASQFVVFPYNASVPLTAQGTLPSCVAPPVKLAYQFAFCFVATYLPTTANGYYTSVTISGLFNTSGMVYGGTAPQYLILLATGRRNASTLVTPTTVTALSTLTTYYGADNLLMYPAPANGVPVDTMGISVYSSGDYNNIYLTPNGTLGYLRVVDASQSQPSSATFTIIPYNGTVQLTSQGTMPTCVAPVYPATQFAFCFTAIYQPTVANGYYTSITFSGVFTASLVSGGNTPQYLAQTISGQRTVSTLTAPSTLGALGIVYATYGADNLLMYPPAANGAAVDAAGVTFTSSSVYYTLYLTANGTVALRVAGAAPTQGQPQSSTFTLLPYNASVPLTAQGTLPSCVAPAVQLMFQFAFCYTALYQPNVNSGYYTSVLFSGVLNTTGAVFGGNTTQYLVQSASGVLTISSLTSVALVGTIASGFLPTFGGDNLLQYPAPTNGSFVDTRGISFAVLNQLDTLYTTANGTVAFLKSGSSPTGFQQPQSTSLTVIPYNASVQLTPQGTLPSCTAPPVQLHFLFAFCFIAVYQPTVTNGYSTSVTFSGVLNTTGAIYGGVTTQYLLLLATGQRNLSTLMVPTTVLPLQPYITSVYGEDNYVLYPPPTSGASVDARGISIYAGGFDYTLYLTANGTVGLHRSGTTPPQGEPSSTSFSLFPYNVSVPLTAQGALSSCVAPAVQLVYQFTFCYAAAYQPTAANGNVTSLSITGVFNTSVIYGQSSTAYLVQSASGQRNVSSLTAGSSVVPNLFVTILYDNDNLLFFPPSVNGSFVDPFGITLYSYLPANEYSTIYLTPSGATARSVGNGAVPSQGQPLASTFNVIPYDPSVRLVPQGGSCPVVGLTGSQSASLCILLYSLPGSVDYPFSVAYSLRVTYSSPVVTGSGTAVTLLSGTGSRTFTNRFGDSFSTLLTLNMSAGQTVLYLNSASALRSSTLSFSLSVPVQLPGADPTQLVSTTTLTASSSGVLSETGASIFDAAGQAVLTTVPGANNATIGASNQNALAAVYATCQAPISFTNGLRTPTEPVVGNGAVHFTYSYTISDGTTFSVQANLSVTATSGFATTMDQLSNPYQTVVNITGIRLYTHLPTSQTLLSTITGLAANVLSLPSPHADQRFYPYSLLASAPGVYTINTAPFIDAAGLAYSVSPAVPADGQPVVGSALYGSVGVYLNTMNGAGVALLAESNMAGAVSSLQATAQRQTFVLG